MIKKISIVVDGETIPFVNIFCNSDGTASNRQLATRLHAFSNNPKIVDITNLTFIPPLGSRYDPESNNFIFDTDSYSSVAVPLLHFSRHALLVDNLIYVVQAFDLSTESGQLFDDIFRKNPTFIVEEIILD